MTAEHNLREEFREYGDALTERRKSDPGFDGLVGRYQEWTSRSSTSNQATSRSTTKRWEGCAASACCSRTRSSSN